MTQVLAYCRCSSMTNSEGDTFVRQMASIRRYAERNDMEVVRGYEEVISGTKEWEHRPEWVSMMRSLNGVKTIIIERLDRLARDLMVQEHIIADLKARGLVLISVAEPDLCLDDPTRTLLRQIMAGIAQYERTMIVAKLKGARDRKKLQTGKCEGRKAFGARPGEDVTFAEMVKLRNQGLSYSGIADNLNTGGFSSRTGKPWFASVVRDVILRNSA